jgi:hypothetical protein
MPRLYEYVGPHDVRQRTEGRAPGMAIRSRDDLERWMSESGKRDDHAGWTAATFVIDAAGELRLDDRRSEHVACAGGGQVFSAGEMFFAGGAVVEVTNQSTGYCPEPESWAAVAAALDRAGIDHPGRFTQEIVFRRCPKCGQRNIVKDGFYSCASCETDLPSEWNFTRSDS